MPSVRAPVVTLQGSLRDASVADLLMLYHSSQASGCLHVSGVGGLFGELYLESGQLVHALVGPWRDLDALAIALAWSDGHFSMHAGQPAPERTLEQPLAYLIEQAKRRLEGLRITLLDTAELNLNSVLRTTPPHRMQSNQVVLTPADLALLLRLDGQASLVRLAPNINLGHTEVLRLARNLVALGVAELVNSEEQPVTADFLRELRLALAVAVGPIGEILLADALDAHGVVGDRLPAHAVAGLLESLRRQIKQPEVQSQFSRQASALWRQHQR